MIWLKAEKKHNIKAQFSHKIEQLKGTKQSKIPFFSPLVFIPITLTSCWQHGQED